MTSASVRPASITDVESIVEVRLGALTEEEIFGFTAQEYAIFCSTEKLKKCGIAKIG